MKEWFTHRFELSGENLVPKPARKREEAGEQTHKMQTYKDTKTNTQRHTQRQTSKYKDKNTNTASGSKRDEGVSKLSISY